MFFKGTSLNIIVLFTVIDNAISTNDVNSVRGTVTSSLHRVEVNARNNLMDFIKKEGRRLEEGNEGDNDEGEDNEGEENENEDAEDENEEENENEDYEYEEQESNYYRESVDWSNIGFNVSDMALKYNGCSAIQTYNDEYAANGYSSPLSTKRFAVFRLCPKNKCSFRSSMGCSKNFGEYILELDTFLQGLVEYNEEKRWQSCNFCSQCNALESFGAAMEEIEFSKNGNRRRLDDNENDNGNNDEDEEAGGDDDGNNIYNMWDEDWNEEWLNTDWRYLPYCSSDDLSFCANEAYSCDNYGDNNGQKSIEDFTQCVNVGNGYYVGPMCGSDGYTIELGVYSDSNCDNVAQSKTVESVLGYSISDSFAYPSDCYSCEQKSKELLYNNYLQQGDDYSEWLQENFEAYLNDYGYNDNANNYDDDANNQKVGYYYNRNQLYSEGNDGVVGFYSKNYQFVEEDDDEYGQFTQYGIANICGDLYELSAKCNKNLENAQDLSSYTSEQQLEDEDMVCIFAENVRRKRYSEEGAVVLDGTKYINEIDWLNPEEVSNAYKIVGIGPVHFTLLLGSILGCIFMILRATWFQSELVRQNIPWRPTRGVYGHATEIATQYSGILMGRSTTNPSMKDFDDDKRTNLL